jgi:hypothetical protein
MRRTLVAAIALASTAALASGATVAAASASTSGVRAAKVPHEHFRIISTTAGAKRQSVLATGAFTAGGYQVPGKLVNLRSTDKMVFPGGTFLVARHITRQWLPLPSKTCFIQETLRGSYTLSHGTGAYRGISGSGSFVTRIRGVIRRSKAGCGGPMTVFQEIGYTGGTVRR